MPGKDYSQGNTHVYLQEPFGFIKNPMHDYLNSDILPSLLTFLQNKEIKENEVRRCYQSA